MIMIGQRFGRLTVLGEAGYIKHGEKAWECACDCGNRKVTVGSGLRSGKNKSCGCLKREWASQYFKTLTRTHGATNTPEYICWREIRQRCHNPNHAKWGTVGGRGILISEAWDRSFTSFLADVGPRPTARHSLRRINRDGDYEPGNLQWQLRGRVLPKPKAIPPSLIGQTFGRLTVLSEVIGSKRFRLWICTCACGNEARLSTGVLRSGKTRSCGCLAREVRRDRKLRHGEADISPEWKCWQSIRQRCLNPKRDNSQHYVGRGIKLCDRWLNSYEDFLLDMGRKPAPEYSIERLNNNLGYEPGNCKWATQTTQMNNTRANLLLTFEGRTLTVTEWARVLGVNSAMLFRRLKVGWSVERVLTTPVGPTRRGGKKAVQSAFSPDLIP